MSRKELTAEQQEQVSGGLASGQVASSAKLTESVSKIGSEMAATKSSCSASTATYEK